VEGGKREGSGREEGKRKGRGGRGREREGKGEWRVDWNGGKKGREWKGRREEREEGVVGYFILVFFSLLIFFLEILSHKESPLSFLEQALEAGANPLVKNLRDTPAIFLAAEKGAEQVELFLEHPSMCGREEGGEGKGGEGMGMGKEEG
jgi:hypothetical protein